MTVGILTSGASAYAPGVAVTVASTVTYVGGQLVGAFLGASACYLAYKRHFDEHTGADDQGPAQEAPAWRESSELDRDTAGGRSERSHDGKGREQQGARVAVRERDRVEARTTTSSRRPDPAGAADTLGVFSTGPAIASPVWNLVTEVIGIFVLVLVVLLFGKTPSGLGPAAVALLVVGIGASLGGPTGYAVNPARDLGPRIAHAVLPIRGKGSSNWAYAWVPVVGPLVGGILAGLAANALS